MARPSDWSPVDMERDPTPGNPDEVRELADDLQTFADDVGEALGRIRGMAEDRAVLDWAGLSAEAFRSEFDGVPGNLQKLQTSYDMAAQALATYWPTLETAQGMADRALDRAITAQADLSSAQAALTDAQDWVSRAGEEADRLEREGEREGVEPPSEAEVRAATRDATAANEAASSAQGRVDAAEEALSAARQLAQDAKEMREEAARTCASEIDAASDAGIQNRRWWEDAIHWVSENWDTIVEICKVVVAVLGIVVMIIGGPLAWVVLAAALVVLADTLYDYANGRASLWDVAFAALDCIPGMRGLTTLGGLARGLRGLATTGLRGLRQGLRGLGQSLRRMGRQSGDLVCETDPIDMATGEMVMSATDVRLPGALSLLLTRHHRTSLCEGTWFGPSWASTLDQRLVLDEAGLRFVTDDGTVLDYPRPIPQAAVLPVEGPRWGLFWDGAPDGALLVQQDSRGLTLHFAPVPGRLGSELPLIAITDRNGNRISVKYDAAGAPSEIAHDGGYRVGVTVGDRRIRELRLLSDPERPVLMRYAYDERGNLSQIHNPAGTRPLTLTYDDKRRITGWEDRNGTWYRYTYDEHGRCVATDGTGGALGSRIVYDTETNRTLYTNSLGHTTVYEFNDCYQLITETDPLGHHTHRTWDRYDRLLSVTDAERHTTSYTYDDHGNLTELTHADGTQTSAAYHQALPTAGLPTEIAGPDGASWTHTYDERGNRLTTRDPAGNETHYRYDDSGHLVTVIDAIGNIKRIDNDDAGLPMRVIDPLGHVTRVERDSFGRVTRVIDPLGSTTRIGWTAEGRPAWSERPDGTRESWQWDDEGNLLSHTDASGNTTTHTYTFFDLPATRTTPDGHTYTFTHDTELRLTGVTNGRGDTWRYEYDAAGRLTSENDFNGRSLLYAHDSLGRLTSRTNGAGQRLEYLRDAMGRTVRQTDSEGGVTTFAYSPSGHLVHAANEHATVALERDLVGRPLSESVNGRITTFAYDALGRRTRRTTPSGLVSTWSYDPAGRPTALRSEGNEVRFDYDPTGFETARAFGHDILLTRDRDASGRMTGQSLLQRRAANDRLIHRRSYTYREDGLLRETADSAGFTRTFTLDAVGRITAVTAQGWEERYAYDALGNVTDVRSPDHSVDGEREFAGTLLSRAGRTFYEHDAQGRLIRRTRRLLNGQSRSWMFEWNAEDRLVHVTTPQREQWRYTYDPMGRRIGKTLVTAHGGVAESVVFDWEGSRLAEQTEHGTVTTWDYSPESYRPLAQTERRLGGDTQDAYDVRFYAIVTDLVGKPTELVSVHGEVLWRDNSTLWGLALPDTPLGDVHCPLRFPGQYHDRETGLHYNLFRHYDPETARYTSADPLGLAPAPNHHGYVVNPQTESDPIGLAPCHEFFTVQNADHAARLRGSGTPWPSAPHEAHFGPGVYAWGDLASAERYATMLARREGMPPLEIMRFRVAADDLASMRQIDVGSLSDDAATDFMNSYSLLWDGVPNHGFEYISRPTNMGSEHFFDSSVFGRLNFD